MAFLQVVLSFLFIAGIVPVLARPAVSTPEIAHQPAFDCAANSWYASKTPDGYSASATLLSFLAQSGDTPSKACPKKNSFIDIRLDSPGANRQYGISSVYFRGYSALAKGGSSTTRVSYGFGGVGNSGQLIQSLYGPISLMDFTIGGTVSDIWAGCGRAAVIAIEADIEVNGTAPNFGSIGGDTIDVMLRMRDC